MTISTQRKAQPENARRHALRSLKPVLPPLPRESLITVEQWAALGEVKPPYELLNGVLIRKMVTTNEHDWTARRIARFCDEWADSSGWRFFSQGAGTRLDLFNGFVPDVMGFGPDVPLEGAATYNPPPFIAFEVLSPRTAKADRGDKKRVYQSAEVALYVLVDLKKRSLEIYRLREGQYGKPEILQSDALWQPPELAGFQLEVSRLWFA